MKALLKQRISLVAAAVAACVSGAASATTVGSDVAYGYIHGYLEIYNPTFTSVASGSYSGNTAVVDAGSSVTLQADWRIVTTDGNGAGYCPGCIIQEYAAWIPPAADNGATPFNLGLLSFSDGFNPNGLFASGQFSWTTAAPTLSGTYFIGGGSSLDFNYLPGLQGNTGVLMSDFSVGDLASFKVTVGSVPEPGSVALLGFGLLGLALIRSKKS